MFSSKEENDFYLGGPNGTLGGRSPIHKEQKIWEEEWDAPLLYSNIAQIF